jgi:hypothetical protein
MKYNLLIKSLIGAFLLTFIGGLLNLILGLPHNLMYYIWSVSANFLVTLVVGYYILHSNCKGMLLSAIVFIIYFVVGHFNILNEALIFNVTDQGETIMEIINGFFVVLIFSPAYVYLLGKWGEQSNQLRFIPRSVFGWIWRVTVADVLYFFIYAFAGFTLQMVYPELLDFYEGKIPPIDLIIQTQFVRGLIFVGITILILRTTNVALILKVLLVGAVFSILGGVAPLIPPNEFMPFNIRVAHGVEVGVSNFIYGLVTGYLLGQGVIAEENIATH